MADTNRARSALEALFADNTSGDISPQDLRDFLRSVQLLNVPRTATGTTDTFIIGDADNTVIYSSGDSPAVGCTVTIPANASVAFPIGTKIAAVRKSGLVTFSPAGGVTLNKPTGIRPNRFMGAMAIKSADQTTANYTTDTAIPWDGTDPYDTDAFHDPVTNNTRLTIPTGLGIKKARFAAVAYITSFSGTWHALRLAKTTSYVFSGFAGIENEVGGLTEFMDAFASSPVPVADADYFEAKLQVATDTSITVEQEQSSFSVEVVEIDPVGTIAYQYGMVWLEKIDTNEWNIYGPGLG